MDKVKPSATPDKFLLALSTMPYIVGDYIIDFFLVYEAKPQD
jgi:hypothetical protein